MPNKLKKIEEKSHIKNFFEKKLYNVHVYINFENWFKKGIEYLR